MKGLFKLYLVSVWACFCPELWASTLLMFYWVLSMERLTHCLWYGVVHGYRKAQRQTLPHLVVLYLWLSNGTSASPNFIFLETKCNNTFMFLWQLFIKQLQMGSRSKWLLVGLLLLSRNDNIVIILFLEIQINQSLPKDIFSCRRAYRPLKSAGCRRIYVTMYTCVWLSNAYIKVLVLHQHNKLDRKSVV